MARILIAEDEEAIRGFVARALTQDGHQVMTASTEMILISDDSLPAVNAELRYYCDDPFAVQMLLSVDQSPAICWTFGRELLMVGVRWAGKQSAVIRALCVRP